MLIEVAAPTAVTVDSVASGASSSPMPPDSVAASNPSRSVFAAATRGTMFRPHWQQAEIAISRSRRTRRSRRASSSCTTLRAVGTRMIPATPNSTAFSTSQSSLSPTTQACTSVIASRDSRSIARCRPRTTQVRAPAICKRPLYSPPRPLKSVTAAPSRSLSTRIAWWATASGSSTSASGARLSST